MEQSTEKQTGFLGTYFDHDTALRVARWMHVLAWVLLGFYLYMTVISLAQYWSMLAAGIVTIEGLTILDRMLIPAQQLLQLAPGLVYFVMLKAAQQVLLILLDVEDNSRRAARK